MAKASQRLSYDGRRYLYEANGNVVATGDCATVIEVQQQVGDMEDMIKIMVDKKMENVADRLRGDMCNQIREEMREHSNMVRDQKIGRAHV